MKRPLFIFLVLVAGAAQAALVREGASSLGTIGIGAGVVDAAGGYAYFIDTGSLTLQANPPFQFTQLAKIRLSDLSQTASALYSSTFSATATQIQNAAVIDPTGGFAYFAFGQSSTTLAQFRLSDFTQVSSATLSPSLGHFNCGVIDPTTSYAYFGTDTAQIVKINLPNLTVISSITLPSPNADLRSVAIDTQNHFIYFGSSTTPGNVAKINLTNFSFVGTLTFNGSGAALSAFLDAREGYLWVGTGDSPGEVVQIQLDNFQVRGNPLTLFAKENRLASALYNPSSQTAYFGTDTSTGIIVEVNAAGMKRVGNLTLNSGEAYLETAVMDANQFGYFGTLTNPGQVIKVDLIGGVPDITSIAPPEEDVSIGQTASFSVSATGRNLVYQWNRNGAPIAGAIQTAYQLTNVALTDDGAIFDCSVSNSSGTATSGSTTLTVNPDIHVYPDPWRADRHAGLPVTFNQILPGASVEIFTLAAQWVRTIPESGGLATWDLKNNAGQNAASGYYFYYVKTTDDRHTLRGKFAIIR